MTKICEIFFALTITALALGQDPAPFTTDDWQCGMVVGPVIVPAFPCSGTTNSDICSNNEVNAPDCSSYYNVQGGNITTLGTYNYQMWNNNVASNCAQTKYVWYNKATNSAPYKMKSEKFYDMSDNYQYNTCGQPSAPQSSGCWCLIVMYVTNSTGDTGAPMVMSYQTGYPDSSL